MIKKNFLLNVFIYDKMLKISCLINLDQQISVTAFFNFFACNPKRNLDRYNTGIPS